MPLWADRVETVVLVIAQPGRYSIASRQHLQGAHEICMPEPHGKSRRATGQDAHTNDSSLFSALPELEALAAIVVNIINNNN